MLAGSFGSTVFLEVEEEEEPLLQEESKNADKSMATKEGFKLEKKLMRADPAKAALERASLMKTGLTGAVSMDAGFPERAL